ncbi:MAG: Fe-S cluster assembly protein SufB [Candidatus Micrarchaeota archaeon]
MENLEKKKARELVMKISKEKKDPKWMLDLRLEALEIFFKKTLPKWMPDISGLDLKKLTYYLKPFDKAVQDWNKVPKEIKKQFDDLGIPEAEKQHLAGSGAQYESEVIYHKIKEQWERQGVIFKDMGSAVKENPEIVKKYFGKLVPASDNLFAALNTAFWSGGSFVFVPKGVKVEIPIQMYFKINSARFGQFERTLIIGEEGSEFQYVEGCTAPSHSTASLHAAVVEVFVHKDSHAKYTTIQNWSSNIYNLVTKRAIAYENAYVEWVDGNIGSKVTCKYPSIILKGRGARAEILSVAYAKKGQIQDTGAKAIHLAPDTSSKIISKGICKEGGKQVFRGLIKVAKGAIGTKANMVCDSLIVDNNNSTADAMPELRINEQDVSVSHEAKVGKIGEDQLFYLMTRGLTEAEAISTIVLGFVEPFAKELPMEYAVELNRLIQSDMRQVPAHGGK